MKFKIIARRTAESHPEPHTVYLEIDNWNDFSFVTLFSMRYRDGVGLLTSIGGVKIGFKGQPTSISTNSILPKEFEFLDEKYFSLGQGAEFYQNIAKLPGDVGKSILLALRDIVSSPEIIDEIQNEKVFSASLLREISLSLVKGQFHRALLGAA